MARRRGPEDHESTLLVVPIARIKCHSDSYFRVRPIPRWAIVQSTPRARKRICTWKSRRCAGHPCLRNRLRNSHLTLRYSASPLRIARVTSRIDISRPRCVNISAAELNSRNKVTSMASATCSRAASHDASNLAEPSPNNALSGKIQAPSKERGKQRHFRTAFANHLALAWRFRHDRAVTQCFGIVARFTVGIERRARVGKLEWSAAKGHLDGLRPPLGLGRLNSLMRDTSVRRDIPNSCAAWV